MVAQHPSKVCHFLWRACRDTLSTKENLVQRKVLADGCYELCNSGVETSSHLFWKCSQVRDVWASLKLFHMQTFIRFKSFMDMVWYGVVETEWDKELIEKMVMVAWSLWTYRNEFQNGGVKKIAIRIRYDALEYLAEYQECVKEPKQRWVVLARILEATTEKQV